MSLLLDALKKAADDKKKVSQDEPARPELENASQVAAKATAENSPVKAVEEHDDSDVEAAEELSLDLEEIDLPDANQTVEKIKHDDVAESASVIDSAGDNLDVQIEDKHGREASGAYEISDDALSMLIYKTNREVKRSNRVIVFSVLMISLAVLVGGGFYYYMDMQAEIANLERKHQIAMQSMRSKTNNEKTPEKSAVIRNLVGGSDLEEKVEYAKKHMADENNAKQVEGKSTVKKAVNNNARATTADKVSSGKLEAGVLSIERTNKSDPVADKLDDAWLDYENARYGDARKLYDEVLGLEVGNRDAYLGLGAIAIIEKDNETARNIYRLLLEQDPRDPIATAAIANLHSDDSTLQSDEKYLLSMLQKNPGAMHLNFALGNVYSKQGKWKSAQQSYFSAWQSDHDNADYLYNLAVSLDQLGKQDQAVRFYEDSLQKSNNKQISFSREAVRNRINELSRL